MCIEHMIMWEGIRDYNDPKPNIYTPLGLMFSDSCLYHRGYLGGCLKMVIKSRIFLALMKMTFAYIHIYFVVIVWTSI